MVHVRTVGSSGGSPDVGTVRAKDYPSQSTKSILKEFFEHNFPTHLDATHQTTSFSADQMIQFAKAVGLQVSLASFGMLEDLLLKANLIGGGGGVEEMRPVGRCSIVVPRQMLEIVWHLIICIPCQP